MTERYKEGTKVEIVPRGRKPSWPGGVGTVVHVSEEYGGYTVRQQDGKTHNWCWDEVVPARSWWSRLRHGTITRA